MELSDRQRERYARCNFILARIRSGLSPADLVPPPRLDLEGRLDYVAVASGLNFYLLLFLRGRRDAEDTGIVHLGEMTLMVQSLQIPQGLQDPTELVGEIIAADAEFDRLLDPAPETLARLTLSLRMRGRGDAAEDALQRVLEKIATAIGGAALPIFNFSWPEEGQEADDGRRVGEIQFASPIDEAIVLQRLQKLLPEATGSLVGRGLKSPTTPWPELRGGIRLKGRQY